MPACRAACSRSNGRAPYSKLDKVLLALTITGFVLSAIFAATVFRMAVRRHRHYDYEMLRPHHHRHHGHHGGPTTPPPNMEETDCQVEDFDPESSEVECARNERGEWCAAGGAPPPPPRPVQRRDADSREDSREERDGRPDGMPPGPGHHGGPGGMRPGHHGGPGGRRPDPEGRGAHEEGMRPMPHGEGEGKPEVGRATQEGSPEPALPATGVRQDPSRQGRRHFPCMRMRVQMRHRERMMDAMAHQNLSEATNFPGCSFSSCEEDPDVNRRRMEEMRRHWEQQRHQPTRCLVNRDQPGHVIILRHHLNRKAFIKSCGFQLTFWSFVLGNVFFVALVIRRCRSKKTETKKVNPQKLPGGAYLVTTVPTDNMSDKEKEAFGFSVPVVSDNPIPGAPKEFLMLAPPAYDMKSADMQVEPPAYAPEKEV